MSDSSSGEPKPSAGAIFVGKCNVHRAQDRYGEEAKNALQTREHSRAYVYNPSLPSNIEWPWLDEENDGAEPTGPHIYQEMPDVQLWRMNLTALSQSFPLYFGAFKGRIFAYTISTAMTDGKFIQQFPDLQLVTQPTSKGRKIGGTIEPQKGHIINHMITGFLGDQEIVAVVFDNGDVLAYSILAVWAEIERRSKDPAPKRPQPHALTCPFFHDNVGDSAWGLAIHKQSGLLAVSSNLHEVTVFAFAETQTSSVGHCEGCENGIEDQVRRRARLWRVVIGFGSEANNLPNIAFIDDDDGDATAVCAMDIEGKTWISPIWTHARSVYALTNSPDEPWDRRGWGVVPLPFEAFMVVTSSEDLLGGRHKKFHVLSLATSEYLDREDLPLTYDSHENLLDVPDNPCLHDLKAHVTTHLNAYVRELRRLSMMVQFRSEMLIGLASDVEKELHENDWSALLFRSRKLEYNGLGQSVSWALVSEGDGSDEDEDEAMDGEGEVAEDFEHDDEEEGVEEVWPVPAAASESGPASVIVRRIQAGGERMAMALDGLAEESAQNDREDLDERRTMQSHCCGADYQMLEGWCILLPMTYLPNQQRMARDVPEAQSLGKGLSVHRNKLPRSLWKRYRFFTTHTNSLALLAPEPHTKETGDPPEVEIRFSKVVGPYSDLDIPLERFRFHPGMRRLNMLHHAPELSLLVIGSSTGWVILVTPTRMAQRDRTRTDWDFGFRVEAILPRASDVEAHGLAREPLHGIAVGPMYYGEERPLEKRYLLTMHYRNHDIVTYELGREAHRERTVIF